MRAIRIPAQLAKTVDEDGRPGRLEWRTALPAVVAATASEWQLTLGDPYLPSGQCSWVAPVRTAAGHDLVLKVGWRHREAEHEADALRFWEGDGAVRCLAARSLADTSILLLERCMPGHALSSVPERDQDEIIAGLLRRLWTRVPKDDHPFASLEEMCAAWADELELDLGTCRRDSGLVREAIALLRGLPRSASSTALLCTDLHAGNVLAAQREPWLVIDPKPFVGDPAYDVVQHMLNCGQRLANDPVALADRMAGLLELDAQRVRLWLFARCAQESVHDVTMREAARRLAP